MQAKIEYRRPRRDAGEEEEAVEKLNDVDLLDAEILSMTRHGCLGVFGRVICEKAQKLKHLSTLAHKSVKELEAPLIDLLTVTPMLNKPNDLEGLLRLLYQEDWARLDLGGAFPASEEYEKAFQQMQRTPVDASNMNGFKSNAGLSSKKRRRTLGRLDDVDIVVKSKE